MENKKLPEVVRSHVATIRGLLAPLEESVRLAIIEEIMGDFSEQIIARRLLMSNLDQATIDAIWKAI